jgi:hypothetical protein
MRYFICICHCLLVMISLHSQEIKEYDLEMQAKHSEQKGYDASFRVNYFENIILRTELSSDVTRLQFFSGRTGELLAIRPVAEYRLGYSLDYKWVAVGFSFTPKFLLNTQNIEELNNGESLGFNINFYYTDQWRQELGYQYYKGFFRDGPQRSTGLGDVLLENTTLKTIQGSTFFIVNPEYSFRAHYIQTERQLKSAGSLIPRLRYSFSALKPNFGNLTNYEEVVQINSLDFTAQIGYLYTFVYERKWFATVGLHPGFGYNYSLNRFSDGSIADKTYNSLTFALNNEVGLGYNNYRWFFGVAYNWRNYNYANNQKDQFARDFVSFNIYMGYRFNDNKPMRKFFGWFEDNLGF